MRVMASSKRNSITLEKKKEIINVIENGKMKQSDVVRNYNLSKSTVNTIWKNRRKYEDSISSGLCGHNAKRIRQCNFENLERALVIWIKQVHSENFVIDGPILKEKALMFAAEMGYEDFSGSDGWFDRFKNEEKFTSVF